MGVSGDRPTKVCHLLREDPELGQRIPSELRAQAEAECVTAVLSLRRGQWSGDVDGISGGVGLLVLEGLLLRRLGIEARFGAELLGEGDLLRPWQADRFRAAETRWKVLAPARLAILDRSATRRITRYPEIVEELVERALGRTRSLAANMAIIHQPGIETRLEQLLWLLADRWGKVAPGGVRVPVKLTHAVLAEMVGARRPTVTTALSEMARRGRLVPLAGGGWELHGEPPADLGELRTLGAPQVR
jgi:hypothetical protein